MPDDWTIRSEQAVGDGWDVDVITDEGKVHIVHFAAQPTLAVRDSRVAEVLERLSALAAEQAAAEIEVETEDGGNA